MSSLFTDVIFLLGSSVLIATLFHYFRMPPFVGFLASGIIVGPFGLGIVSSMPNVTFVTEAVAILLLFTLGLEFSFKSLKQKKRYFLTWGLGQVVLTSLTMTLLFYFVLGITWQKALFFSFLVALSSTATVFRLLEHHRDIESPHGQSSISILIFQDLAIIPMIFVLPFLDGFKEGIQYSQIFISSLKAFVLIALILFCARTIVPKLLEKVVKTRSREIFFFFILFLIFSAAFVLKEAGLSLSLGAFFAGVLLSNSAYGKQIASEFTPLRDNFLGIFFISAGILLKFDFLAENFLGVLFFSALLFFLKGLIIFLVLWILGASPVIALFSALLLFQMGEFSFILLQKGLSLQLISPLEEQYFLAMTIFSLGLTPFIFNRMKKIRMETLGRSPFINFMVNLRVRLLYFLPNSKVDHQSILMGKDKVHDHAIICGFGVAGQSIAASLRQLDIPYRIIDLNYETVQKFSLLGEPIIYGDASHEKILHDSFVESARVIIITVAGTGMTEAIVRRARESNSQLVLIVRSQYLMNSYNLPKDENIKVVVAETESIIEILSQSLQTLGVDTAIKESHCRDLAESLRGSSNIHP